jgi:hypothetical protein
MERDLPQGTQETPREVVAAQFRETWLPQEVEETSFVATAAGSPELVKRDVAPVGRPAAILKHDAQGADRFDAGSSYVLSTLGTLCKDVIWALLFIGALLTLQALIL